MNLLLLEEQDFQNADVVVLSGRRAKHLLEVIGVENGSTVRCGKLGNNLGTATVQNIDGAGTKPLIHLNVTLTRPPPEASAIELLCALPRPKMLRRIIRTAAELGIKRISLVNSYRVEKSYWQSPQLSAQALHSFCLEGLEQCGDTILPQISLHKRFKPYVEDELPAYLADKHRLLAHPNAATQLSNLRPPAKEPCVLAIGPEGGFIDYELQRLQETGFVPFSLGPRIYRCDTAVPYLLAALQAVP